MDKPANLKVMDHPLVQHKIAMLRDKSTGCKQFRELIEEVTVLITYEATRDLPLCNKTVETPVAPANVKVLGGKTPTVMPILRAGLGMVSGVLALIPSAKVGHIGLYRDSATLQPVEYYFSAPADIKNRQVIVVDPMLATGGSASAAIDVIKKQGAKGIKFICIVAAPEGVKYVCENHPNVQVYCGAVDPALNSKGYIVPGLGDAGDRLFGTD